MADSIIGKISVGDGATFTPDVTDGVLSFTNNKNLPNPEPYNIAAKVLDEGENELRTLVTAAETAAGNAATSETNAHNSEQAAKASETAAATSASAAKTSETNAASSETAAATSATNAATSETNASNSASAAATSESNASDSATAAAASAEEVEAALDDYLPLSGGTLTGVVNGVTPAAGDNSTKIATTEFVNAAAGLPVGFQYFQTNPNVPAGSLPLLGGEYSRETYADLWAWVQTQSGYLLEESAWQAKAAANGGNVPFYSKGDGSTTFRVPALKCWVRGANSINEVGGYLAAGLPNITGSIGGGTGAGGPAGSGSGIGFLRDSMINGCFQPSANSYGSKTGSGGGELPSGYSVLTANLDASRSSSVYGKSDTVQPESIVGMWVVKAYGTVTNVGSTDVANISTGLTQAETRISALENHGAGVLPGTVTAFSGTFKDGYPVNKNTGLVDREWHLCDGTNGTPDLRNRFIYGGDGTNNGTKGGEASVTLTVQTIPAHGHTGKTSANGNHSHTVTTFKDHHKINGNKYDGYCTGSTDRTTSTAGNHQHSLNIDSTGGGQPHNNMPPYYVLAFIMKL